MSSQLLKKIVTGDEIRNAFLNFYSEKLHKIIPSASLIPEDYLLNQNDQVLYGL